MIVGSGGCALGALVRVPAFAIDDDLLGQAVSALDRAAVFFRSVATGGGYLWSYSTDLEDRRGEEKATKSQVWVQPPGTPSVGGTYLRANGVIGKAEYREAAALAADALVYGQLESGGWDYLIDFDPERDLHLRREIAATLSAEQRRKRKNVTTFDDDNTQSAIRFLMACAQTPGVDENRPRSIREAIDYALAGMLRAQYPNGAFPQRYDGAPRKAEDHPAVGAKFPESWPREWPKPKYQFFYTLNDNAIRDCVTTLLEAHRRLGEPKYLDAAKRAGDFLIVAQMPEPQPVWAQQYAFDMTPAWARKFEPPAVCSNESAGAIRSLVDLYLASGEEKYLKPIPAAVAWFGRSRLPSGKWARFYELRTNRPLYFTKDYRLTYDDSDVPTHYSFSGEYGVAGAIGYCEAVKAAGREKWLAAHVPKKPTGEEAKRRAAAMEERVRGVIAALDEKGRWLGRDGRIESKLFVQNVATLCDYIEAARAGRP
jgi:hypothetical protein